MLMGCSNYYIVRTIQSNTLFAANANILHSCGPLGTVANVLPNLDDFRMSRSQICAS